MTTSAFYTAFCSCRSNTGSAQFTEHSLSTLLCADTFLPRAESVSAFFFFFTLSFLPQQKVGVQLDYHAHSYVPLSDKNREDGGGGGCHRIDSDQKEVGHVNAGPASVS